MRSLKACAFVAGTLKNIVQTCVGGSGRGRTRLLKVCICSLLVANAFVDVVGVVRTRSLLEMYAFAAEGVRVRRWNVHARIRRSDVRVRCWRCTRSLLKACAFVAGTYAFVARTYAFVAGDVRIHRWKHARLWPEMNSFIPRMKRKRIIPCS